MNRAYVMSPKRASWSGYADGAGNKVSQLLYTIDTRRDISELKLRLRWLRRRKPWRGRCRAKVYENDTAFLVRNARVANSPRKYVCSVKFPTLNIYLPRFIFDKFVT